MAETRECYISHYFWWSGNEQFLDSTRNGWRRRNWTAPLTICVQILRKRIKHPNLFNRSIATSYIVRVVHFSRGYMSRINAPLHFLKLNITFLLVNILLIEIVVHTYKIFLVLFAFTYVIHKLLYKNDQDLSLIYN